MATGLKAEDALIPIGRGQERAYAQHAVLGLEPHFLVAGEVGHQRRDADAEVDVEAVFEFLRRARGHLVLGPRHVNAPLRLAVTPDFDPGIHVNSGTWIAGRTRNDIHCYWLTVLFSMRFSGVALSTMRWA